MYSVKTIGIIVNSNSRKYVRARRDPVRHFRMIGDPFVDVRLTRSVEELRQVLLDFREQGIPFVATSGGDGTIHYTITELMHLYRDEPLPPLLILKGGTMNNISKSIGLKGGDSAILRRAVDRVRRGDELLSSRRDTMKIDESFCFLFGNGLTADFLNEYYRRGKSYTRLIHFVGEAIVSSVRKSPHPLFRGFRGRVFADDQLLDGDTFLGILAGTVENIGLSFTPLPRANELDRSFHLIATGMRPGELARNLMKLRRGIPIESPRHFDGVVRKLRLECDDPFLYTMDGDLFESDGVLTVEAGRSVQLVSV